MSEVPFDIRIDARGTLEAVRRQLDGWPRGVETARKRAMRKLGTWLQRQVLREVAREAQVTQKVLKTLVRFRLTREEIGLRIWIGTNPIKAHHLGNVRWTRRMQGARVGRRLFPGSWSWSQGRTAGLVMERTGRRGRNNNPRLERIDVVRESIHERARRAVDRLRPDINERLQTLMMQELRYQLLREQGAV
jgi:hypothetical protein